MTTYTRNLLSILTTTEKKKVFFLSSFAVFSAIFEVIGISLLLPLLSFLTNPEIVNDYPAVLFLRRYFPNEGAFNIFLTVAPIFIIILGVLVRAFNIKLQIAFSLTREHAISARVVETFLNKPYSWHVKQNSADLVKTALLEVNHIVYQSLLPMLLLLSNSFTVCFIFILLFIMDPWTSLIALSVMGLFYLATFLIRC